MPPPPPLPPSPLRPLPRPSSFLPGRIVVLKLVQIRLRFDRGIIHKRVISSISGSDAYNVFDRNF